MGNDLRLALRALAGNPAYTAVIVLTLALGIGANTAIFSLFDQVVLRLLPVQNPKELVLFHSPGRPQGFGGGNGEPDIEIVGVVANQKNASLKGQTQLFAYIPQSAPYGWRSPDLTIKPGDCLQGPKREHREHHAKRTTHERLERAGIERRKPVETGSPAPRRKAATENGPGSSQRRNPG